MVIVVRNEANSTRQVILTLLKRNQELTVSTLATELEVTEMAVRRHLRELEKEKLIDSRLEKQAMGRPIHKYYLTEKGSETFPRNYSDLSLGILQDVEQLSGSQMVDQLFEQRRERLYEKYEAEIKGSFAERIAALARVQSEGGYMVEYKELDDGEYEFIEYNCPIAQVAKEYPIACTCEQQLFKRLLKTDHVERKSCIAKENTSCCIYKVKENKEE
ncbi:helix-turn-helix transcriptional regulator [Halalkalibacter alkaliphilus]|uniref:Transcriptional regulator n=1 Tax=Halalkalibacter alkaliphilus TaxID=2917993 RepID=A0A9X2CVA3_9BACI|nr:metalloregulator ArsR/SmtB family transcription factor [Halalkalibacter alkaliphilus]MCL7748932.1 transcriptional regulator [Halalkalibacter alkaliphilus]